MKQRLAAAVVIAMCQVAAQGTAIGAAFAVALEVPASVAHAETASKSKKAKTKVAAKPKTTPQAKVKEPEKSAATSEPPVKKVSTEQVAAGEKAPGAAAAKDPKEGKSGSDFKQMLTNKDDDKSPLYVKSDSLALNAKSRVFTYSGNVEVQKGDLRITCDNMIGTYDTDNRLDNVLCKDNVVITRGTELQANANRANYSIKKAIIELTEGPELARDGNVLSADKIMIYVDEDRSEAEGNVRVKVIKAENGIVPGTAPNAAINPAVQAAPTELAEPQPTRSERTVFEPAEVPDDE